MKELLDKLSSYNLFNYLLPGIIFAVLSEKLTSSSFIQQDIILGVFIYYFIGLIISRIGSLIIEPFLKWTSFVHFAEYSEFLSASATDQKLDLLSEANNMYRTFCSLFLLILIMKGYEEISMIYPFIDKWKSIILLIGLLFLFLLSYRKQTKYITQRIKKR